MTAVPVLIQRMQWTSGCKFWHSIVHAQWSNREEIDCTIKGRGDFCIKKKQTKFRYSWEGIVQALHLELLMGRIYAKHTSSSSWGGISKSILLVDYLKGRIYAKSKKSRYLALSLQMTMNLITTFSFTASGKPLIICDYHHHLYLTLMFTFS